MNAQALLNTWLKSNCLEVDTWPEAPTFTYILKQDPSHVFDAPAVVRTVFNFLDSIRAGGLRSLGLDTGLASDLTGPDQIPYDLAHYPSLKYFEFKFCSKSEFCAYEKELVGVGTPFMLSVSDTSSGEDMYGLRSLVTSKCLILDDLYMEFLLSSGKPFHSQEFEPWLLEKGFAERRPLKLHTICDGELR